jgi:hypothetical protein
MESSELESAIYWLSWLKWIGYSSAFLVVIGVAGELLSDFFSAPFEKIVEDARQAEMAEINARAAEANERTEELRKQNLELQGNLLTMRRELSGRWLSTDQVVSLLPKAEKFRGQRVIFEADRNDIEAMLFVLQLQDNLGELARWNVEYRLPSTPPRFGVRIASSDDKRSQEAAAMLVEELGESFRAVLVPSSELLEEGTTLKEGT